MRGRILSAVLLVLSVSAVGRADDRPLEWAEVDVRVVNSVYQTAKLGTVVFNQGRHEECFGLYQGTLMAIQPFLDQRPKLAASVRDKMEKAKSLKAGGRCVLASRGARRDSEHDRARKSRAEESRAQENGSLGSTWWREGCAVDGSRPPGGCDKGPQGQLRSRWEIQIRREGHRTAGTAFRGTCQFGLGRTSGI